MRQQRRRPKRKPVEKPDPDHEELVQSKKSREEEQEDEPAVGTVATTRSTRSTKLPRKHQRHSIEDCEDVEVDLEWPDEAYKKWLHFCCARSTCSPEVKREFAPRPDDNYFQTSSDHYVHY